MKGTTSVKQCRWDQVEVGDTVRWFMTCASPPRKSPWYTVTKIETKGNRVHFQVAGRSYGGNHPTADLVEVQITTLYHQANEGIGNVPRFRNGDNADDYLKAVLAWVDCVERNRDRLNVGRSLQHAGIELHDSLLRIKESEPTGETHTLLKKAAGRLLSVLFGIDEEMGNEY